MYSAPPETGQLKQEERRTEACSSRCFRRKPLLTLSNHALATVLSSLTNRAGSQVAFDKALRVWNDWYLTHVYIGTH